MRTAAKVKDAQEVKVERPRLTEEETLKRMKVFDQRKEQFVASIRKDQD